MYARRQKFSQIVRAAARRQPVEYVFLLRMIVNLAVKVNPAALWCGGRIL